MPNYLPGNYVDVAMYVDTIEWPATSSLGYTTMRPGAQNNFYAPTQAVTFRMWAVDTTTGRVLTDKDVRQAFVSVPNQPKVMMKFGKVFDFKRAREAAGKAAPAAGGATAGSSGPVSLDGLFAKLGDVFLPDQASGWNGKVVMDHGTHTGTYAGLTLRSTD